MSRARGVHVPEHVRRRLELKEGGVPDMHFSRGDVNTHLDARVVFDLRPEGVDAYLRLEVEGTQPEIRRLTERTRDAAVDAAVTTVFVEVPKPATESYVRFGNRRGKEG